MITTEENQLTAAQCKTYDLVKGEFSQNEALEILTDLFLKKINFHQAKNFSQLIRFGNEDPKTTQRISELKLAQEQARNFIKMAEDSGKSVRLSSTIVIELI